MNVIKKDTSQILEFSIYKHFPVSGFLYSIMLWVTMFLIFYAIDWLRGRPERLSVKQSVIGGVVAGVIFYLPSYLSALIMNVLEKPVLRFDINGFYYTPQIWSRSRLCRWGDITSIKIGRGGDDELLIKVYLSNGKSVFINETIVPIDYKDLLKIFQYSLKNIPIKDLK